RRRAFAKWRRLRHGVELMAAREDVRRQQAPRAHHRAVGAAPDRLAPGIHAGAPRSLERGLGDGGIRIQKLLHVAVALVHGHGYVSARLFCGDVVRERTEELLVLLELLRIE